MNTTSLHISIEPDVKEQAQKVADDIGISLSAVVKALLKQFVRTGRLSVGIDEIPNGYMLDSLQRSEEDVKSRKGISFASKKDVLEYLVKELQDEKQSKN